MSNTLTLSGKRYTRSTCHKSKGAANSIATSARKRGNRARVIKVGKSYCVYTGGKRKK